MRAEFAAFKSRMELSPILVGKGFPVIRKDDDGPVRSNYWVARSAKPDRLNDYRYSGVPEFESARRFTYDVRVVTVDADGLDTLGDAVLKQLVGHRLVVPGRTCDPIRLVEDVEEGDGYDRASDLFWRDFSFRFWSRRAA